MSVPEIRLGCEPFRFDGGPIGLLMIHGFTGSPASMRPMGGWFADQGLGVAGPRLPGHGTTVEDLRFRHWTEWFAEVDTALTELRRRSQTVVVFGQSFGASLALHLAAMRPGEVEGLALTSPYVFDARHYLLPLGRLFVRTIRGFGAGDVKKPGQDELAYDTMPVRAVGTMAELMKLVRAELPGIRTPVLVFRPSEDHSIPASNPQRVVDTIGSERKELIDCPSSYHVISLDHDAPMVRGRVLAFARELASPGA